MLLMAIDQRRDWRLANDVEASANQWEILPWRGRQHAAILGCGH